MFPSCSATHASYAWEPNQQALWQRVKFRVDAKLTCDGRTGAEITTKRWDGTMRRHDSYEPSIRLTSVESDMNGDVQIKVQLWRWLTEYFNGYNAVLLVSTIPSLYLGIWEIYVLLWHLQAGYFMGYMSLV